MSDLPEPTLPDEPPRANVVTPIPGPRSEALRARQGARQDARSIHYYQGGDSESGMGLLRWAMPDQRDDRLAFP